MQEKNNIEKNKKTGLFDHILKNDKEEKSSLESIHMESSLYNKHVSNVDNKILYLLILKYTFEINNNNEIKNDNESLFGTL